MRVEPMVVWYLLVGVWAVQASAVALVVSIYGG
jgi:hypothetical protein